MRVEVPPLRYADIVDGRFYINTAGTRNRSLHEYEFLSAPIRRFALAAYFDGYFGYMHFYVGKTHVVVRDTRTLREPTWHFVSYSEETACGGRHVAVCQKTAHLARITCD